MTQPGEVLVGRPIACPACNARRICSSCGSKIRYGKPNPAGRWEQLHMTEADWRRLLLAAAEFDALSAEYEDRPTVVEFVDWLYPDVIVEDAA